MSRRPQVRLVLVMLAALPMAINLNTFVHAGGLYPGGLAGLSLLILEICSRFLGMELPYVLVNSLLNSIPALVSFRFIGRRFTLYSGIMILLSGFLTDLIPFGPLTQDVRLAAVFGGLLSACSVTLCLVVGATSGGTGFVASTFPKNTVMMSGIISWPLAWWFSARQEFFGWDKALPSSTPPSKPCGACICGASGLPC